MLERVKKWAESKATQASAWLQRDVEFMSGGQRNPFADMDDAFDLNKWPYPQVWSAHYYEYLFDVANKMTTTEKEHVMDTLSMIIPKDWKVWYEDAPEKQFYPRVGWMALLMLLYCVELSIESMGETQNETVEWMRAHPHVVPRNRYAADAKSGQVVFKRSLSIADDQFVWLVEDRSDRREWVVKMASSVGNEIANYKRLKKAGGTTVELALGEWYYGKKPVLVMEKLVPLDEYDDEAEIAIQLLSNQLPYLHTFAVHADLKPDNIMKRNKMDGGVDYLIIDMDIHTERLPSGAFKRNHFTPLFHVDLSSPYATCTFHSDLLELYGTVVALTLRRVRVVKGTIQGSGDWSEGVIAKSWPDGNAPDPLRYLETRTADVSYRIDRAMQSALQCVPRAFVILNKVRNYIRLNVNAGGEPALRYYHDLVRLFKEAQMDGDRHENGIHPSQLPPKSIKSCLRCGETARHVEGAHQPRAFCDAVCQEVFYKFH